MIGNGLPAYRISGNSRGRRTGARLGRLGVVVLSCALMCAKTYAVPDDAAAKVRGFYDALLSTMRDGASLGPKGRYERLKPVIGRTFDVPYMISVASGPIWSTLSETQRQDLIVAFGRYVAAIYADRFSNYSGQQLQVLGEQAHAAEMVVDSRIVRANGNPVAVRYLMHRDEDDWRVADVYLEGSISELATRRSEFSTILEQQGPEGLTAMLNQKTEELVGSTAR
jgi:phospholipid transport system substrate-binding protein